MLAAKTYLTDLVGKIDTLVLGCTHYPLLTETMGHIFNDIKMINMGEACAQTVKKRLANIKSSVINRATHKYYVTGSSENFSALGRRIIEEEIHAEKVNIENTSNKRKSGA